MTYRGYSKDQLKYAAKKIGSTYCNFFYSVCVFSFTIVHFYGEINSNILLILFKASISNKPAEQASGARK